MIHEMLTVFLLQFLPPLAGRGGGPGSVHWWDEPMAMLGMLMAGMGGKKSL